MAGYLFYKPIGAIVVNLAPRLDLPPWSMWVTSTLIASIPMATLVWVVNGLIGELRVPSLDVALAHCAVSLVGAVVTLLFNLLPATRAPEIKAALPQDVPEPASSQPTVRFLERLPPELGTNLLALEMEDHYVRAHTALGSDLVLMRLRDAMAELDGVEGEQVHRSWWVARHAVEDVRREGRNVRLILPSGLEAPVVHNVQALKGVMVVISIRKIGTWHRDAGLRRGRHLACAPSSCWNSTTESKTPGIAAGVTRTRRAFAPLQWYFAYERSKRSASITLVQAVTKSRTKRSSPPFSA